ncbi:DNA circularization N-terminal domain-containing protein [Xenorhabdus sp. BG5]|uniref:DNA circularization N-terminal domain-containing protein n=1 Tax=Xenorhabdus sp. BG5 TaxID=2782014 RepID=UPI00187FB55B|nr:DNA circularization N-terminal domain-containing protein [Xenorhabdus sp. BG5]MBE8595340.1 DNA circularization N-terminal domain-containing protein [Xenorhabdus sp. BG5]
MAFIKDAISSLLGTGSGSSWKWAEHLRPASFRGVPFAVISGESVFGRRQAVHEYPYRDTAWIEDLGRATRRITLRGLSFRIAWFITRQMSLPSVKIWLLPVKWGQQARWYIRRWVN